MTEKIFIDATDTPMGRVASFTAKRALAGSKLFVLNSEKAIISGNKQMILEKYKERRALGGISLRGPFHSKDCEKIMKRAIRGMLPDYRLGRGREAWKRIRCFNGVPAEYQKEKLTKIETGAIAKKMPLEELKRKM